MCVAVGSPASGDRLELPRSARSGIPQTINRSGVANVSHTLRSGRGGGDRSVDRRGNRGVQAASDLFLRPTAHPHGEHQIRRRRHAAGDA